MLTIQVSYTEIAMRTWFLRKDKNNEVDTNKSKYINDKNSIIVFVNIENLFNSIINNANFTVYINSLLSETTEVAINQLLTHLPLLRPGNVECKQCYLLVIPELISHCLTTRQYTEQTQQLLSYTLIHPAITSQDRRTLTQWLRQVEDRISNPQPIPNVEDYSNNTPIR